VVAGWGALEMHRPVATWTRIVAVRRRSTRRRAMSAAVAAGQGAASAGGPCGRGSRLYGQ